MLEPPPRLYHYDGLFTDIRSIDLALKLISTITAFVILIIILSWNMTKKDLYDYKAIDVLCVLNQKEQFLQTATLGRKNVVFMSNPELFAKYKHKTKLQVHHSFAPEKLRRKWYGLLFSDETLLNRTQLLKFILHAFRTVPSLMYHRTASLAVNPLLFGKIIAETGLKNDEDLDLWICSSLCELFVFGPDEVFNDDKNTQSILNDEKKAFYAEFMKITNTLFAYHTEGINKQIIYNLINPSSDITSDIISELDRLLKPIICYHLQNITDNEKVKHSPTNFLLEFIKLYKIIKEETDDFMTMKHIVHILTESYLISQFSIKRILKIIFSTLLFEKQWQDKVRIECETFMKKMLQSNEVICPSPGCIELNHTSCLVWTKAIVNEAMRVSVCGWPFGYLRQTLRDGQICEYEFCEGDLILFNQPTYYHNPELWHQTSRVGSTKKVFDPEIFIEASKAERINLPTHWICEILTNYTVCVPNHFVYLFVTSILVHLMGSGWEIGRNPDKSESTVDDTCKMDSTMSHFIKIKDKR